MTSDNGGPDVREAIFPTESGEVYIRFPAVMTNECRDDLTNYMEVLLASSQRTSDAMQDELETPDD